MSGKVGLLACPCCGADPVMHQKGSDWTRTRKVTIKCPECRLQRTDAALRHDMAWLIDVSTKAWNTRTDPKP